MTPTHDSDGADLYKAAHHRAEAIQGLYIHLLVFVVINAGLFGINWFTRGDDGGWWFYWLLIWGVGVALHAGIVLRVVNARPEATR